MRVLYGRNGGSEAMVTENGRLVEYLTEAPEADGTETVFLGRVKRVVTAMQAAFVDIGEELNGFLPLSGRNQTERPLREGMTVAVQKKKAAHDGKGAFLTRDITLSGTYLLLLPMGHSVGVSARVEDEALRRSLHDRGRSLTEGRCGVVMRSASVQADMETLRAEFADLWARWQSLEKRIPCSPAPSVLLRGRTVFRRLVEDYLPRGIDLISTDGTAEELPAGVESRILPQDSLLWKDLEAQREKLRQRRVWLPGGGNIVIDPCEALTVIDVNTARNTGKKLSPRVLLDTDLEACREIALQLRLRQIGGIVIIDMIDLETDAERELVLTCLRECLREDRIKTVVHGFTALGLIEMTRKRQ